MDGETELSHLLRHLSPSLSREVFVFASCDRGRIPPDVRPQMSFLEAEGTTIVLEQSLAIAKSIPFEFPCRMITINIHSSLNAVGLLAEITSAMASNGIAVNAVSAFFHDHLFVPVGTEERAMKILDHLSTRNHKTIKD